MTAIPSTLMLCACTLLTSKVASIKQSIWQKYPIANRKSSDCGSDVIPTVSRGVRGLRVGQKPPPEKKKKENHQEHRMTPKINKESQDNTSDEAVDEDEDENENDQGQNEDQDGPNDDENDTEDDGGDETGDENGGENEGSIVERNCTSLYEWNNFVGELGGYNFTGSSLNADGVIGTSNTPVFDDPTLTGDPIARLRGYYITDKASNISTATASYYFVPPYDDYLVWYLRFSSLSIGNRGVTIGGTGRWADYYGAMNDRVYHIADAPERFVIEYVICPSGTS